MSHLPCRTWQAPLLSLKKLSLTTFLLQTGRLGLLLPLSPAYFCLIAALSSPMPVLASLTPLSVPVLLLLEATVVVVPVLPVAVPVVLPVLAVDEGVLLAV